MSRLALVKSERLNFSSGTEVQITVAERLPPIDRLTTSSAQIFASLGFDLSHFYAIVADFHTRVQYLFSKPRYSVLMSSHLSRSGAARGIRQRIKRHAKQAIGKRASQRVKQPICQNEIRRSRLSL
jgi:hypothetical protein